MRTRELSWRQQEMSCANSSASRYWDCRSSEAKLMSERIWVGAVAYTPKVVTIWEGMRRYFNEEAQVRVEVVLFQSYEAQVRALLAQPGEPVPHIDIAWNTNLAYLQADEWSGHACRAIAMRDTDLGWMTRIVAVSGGPISTIADLKDRTLALGSRDSGHAAILPVYFLEQQGMPEGVDYRTQRFDTDLGKHGDTGTSEVEVVRAVLDGRADARRDRQSLLGYRAQGTSRAGRRPSRDMVISGLQPLHVYRAT